MNDLEKLANDLVKGAIKKSIALFKKSKANKEDTKDTETKDTKDTPKTNAEVKKSNADEVSDRIENNKVDEINTSLHEFNDDAQLELSKQSKGIHSIENTLDYFDQKLFHSQGGDKTKLDNAQTQGSISNPSNPSNPSDSENEEKQGFFSKLKKFFSNNIVGLSVAGSALGQGVYENIDEIMGKSEAKLADDDAKLDKVIAKESGAKVEGEVSLNDAMKDVKPSTQETQEKQVQQVKNDAKSDKPSFLKENPKFNTSPDEKQYILSDYVTNIMNSSGNVEEKKEIYNQIKNRQDINKTEITNLENHINEISNTTNNSTNNTTNQKETNVDVTIKDDRGNVTSQTMTEAQANSVEKDIAKQNELVELTEEAKKNVKASQELEKVQEAENARNSKSNEKLANKALNDVPKTNPTKDLRPQESGGTINNIADWFKSLFSSKTDESNPQQSSGGASSGGGGGGGGGSSGGGGSTQAAAGVSGEAGQQGLSGGEIVSNSDAQKDEAQATKSKELQDKAVAEAKVKEKQQEAFERQNQTPAGNPTNQGSKGSSTPSQNLSSVKANNATKDLAQKTTNPSQKPDTITNEKVINNHKVETLPKDSWDEFNTSKK